MPQQPQQRVFPFVVGCSRSGTTLLRAMLDSHSQLAIPGESHFMVAMARQRELYEGSNGFAPDVFLTDLFSREGFQRWQFPESAVREAVLQAEPASLGDALRAVFAAYAASRRKPLYGDKTPGYVRAMPLLAELFPEARFVHIIRDGRDVALSLLEMEWASGGLEAAARRWRLSIRFGRQGRRVLGPRYREVRYEELIDRPEAVLQDVCAFLGLLYEPAMLRYVERADEIAAPFGRKVDNRHRHVYLAPTKGLRDWRRQMPKEQIEEFERLAGDALDLAGYPRSTVAVRQVSDRR